MGFLAARTIVASIEVEAIAHLDAQPKRPVNLALERFAHRTYQPAVEGAGILWISGHMAQEAASGSGTPVYRGGIVEQTRTIYERVLLILEAVGANFGDVVKMDDVVKTVEFLVPSGLHDYRRTAEIRREYFREPYPPATGVVVHGLPQPDLLIAVDAAAVVSEVKPVADGQ